MATLAIVTIIDEAIDSTVYTFDIYNAEIIEFSTTFTIGVDVMNNSDLNILAENFKTYLQSKVDEVLYNVTFNRTDNVITAILGNDLDADYVLKINGNDFFVDTTLTCANEVYEVDTPTLETREDLVIYSRSPFFFKVSPLVLYDKINVNVYIYRGHKVDDLPINPTYSISKSVLFAGQPSVVVDIHKLVNDYTQNNILPVVSGSVQTTSFLDTVWCYIDCNVTLNNEFIYKVEQTLLAVDGFGFHEELANPLFDKRVLSTINNHIIYNDSKYPLYFVSKDLVSITVNGVNVPFTLNENFNNQYFSYVDVSGYGVGTYNAEFEYTDETIIHTIENKNECRDNLINIIFKNKYGFWQKIPFNKLSKKTMDIDSNDYMPVVTNYGVYSLASHNKKSYMTSGKRKITTNTDFLPEYYNSLFTELMLSEQIYLEESDVVLPVNVTSKSIAYKTKLNDKLIQYTVEFEYSYNVINKVV